MGNNGIRREVLFMLEDYPDVLTPPEVMEILGIGRNLLYQFMQDGTIPAFRMGKKKWRVLKRDLIVYVTGEN